MTEAREREALPKAALEKRLLEELSKRIDCANVTQIHIKSTGFQSPDYTWDVESIDRTGRFADLPIYGTDLYVKLAELRDEFDLSTS